jgi:hypothetical protein
MPTMSKAVVDARLRLAAMAHAPVPERRWSIAPKRHILTIPAC